MSLVVVSAVGLGFGGFGTVWRAAAAVGGGLVPQPPTSEGAPDEPEPVDSSDSTPPDSSDEGDAESLLPIPDTPDLPDKPPAQAQSPSTPNSTPTKSPSPKPERTSTPGASGEKGERTDSGAEDGASTDSGEDAAEASTTRARLEAAIVELTNARRVEAGCEPLRVDEQLQDAALQKSADMARDDYFAHLSPSGLSPWERAEAQGYERPSGENIAHGQETARAVVEEWMESKGHRENILNCESEAIGVGVYFTEDGGPYWTQMFGYE